MQIILKFTKNGKWIITFQVKFKPRNNSNTLDFVCNNMQKKNVEITIASCLLNWKMENAFNKTQRWPKCMLVGALLELKLHLFL